MSDCTLAFEGLFVGEGGRVNCEKKHNFPEHIVREKDTHSLVLKLNVIKSLQKPKNADP